MPKTLALLASVVFLSACGTPAVELPASNTEETENSVDLSVNDFTPPDGPLRGLGDAGADEMRLLSARSEDGVNWTRTQTVISEQANVPDMVVAPDGTIYLYYVGGHIQDKDQTIAAAVSQDNGATWTFKKVTIDGIADKKHSTPGDPDIALRADGTFRLYFTAQLDGHEMPSIQYADGTDGLNFTYGGEAFHEDGYMTIDSSAYYLDGVWRMNTFSDFKTEVIQAVSHDDGDSFEFVKAEDITYDGAPYFVSNPFPLADGSVRFYSFQLHPSEFRSFLTTDGLTWEDEGQVYLKYEEGKNPLEGYYIKDPVVVQLEDGSYLMVYVTRAPY
jgi:hypothetical protein